jgi:hypothetical protein
MLRTPQLYATYTGSYDVKTVRLSMKAVIPAGIGVQLFISRVINDRGEIGAGERF